MSGPSVVGVLAVRLALAAVLLPRGMVKLRRRASFAAAVARYHMLPAWAVPAAAGAIPVVEVLCGVLLLTDALPRCAGVLAAGLLTAFTVGMSVNLMRGRLIDCGCGGPAGDRPVSWTLVARNLLLAVGGAVVALWPDTGFGVAAPLGPGGTRVVSAAAGTAVVIVLGSVAALTALVTGAWRLHNAMNRIVDRFPGGPL